MAIETTNDQLVGIQGDHIVVILPRRVMTKPEALRMAAYLVALADDQDEFPAILKAVQET